MTMNMNTAAGLADARLAVYRLLLSALEVPSPEQFAWLRSREFHDALSAAAAQFDVALPDGDWFGTDASDHEARWIATFEAGLPTPAVPLLASHYNRTEPTPRLLHEHVLMYRRFGRKPADGAVEPADHALNELSFLIHLDEMLADAGDDEAESILRARRDFLKRHAAAWPARAAEQAASADVPPIYRALVELLAAAVEQDLELCEAALAELTTV